MPLASGWGALGWLPLAAAFCLMALGAAALAARRWPALFPAGLLLLGLSAGAVRLASFQAVAPTDVSHLADSPRPLTVTGTVSSDPEARPGGRLTFFLRPSQAETRGQSAQVTGEVAVSVGPEAARNLTLDYGDHVRLEGQLETPGPGDQSRCVFVARLSGPPGRVCRGCGSSVPKQYQCWARVHPIPFCCWLGGSERPR